MLSFKAFRKQKTEPPIGTNRNMKSPDRSYIITLPERSIRLQKFKDFIKVYNISTAIDNGIVSFDFDSDKELYDKAQKYLIRMEH